MKLGNPLAFTPLPVTTITTLSFIALFTILLVVHHDTPPSPKSLTPAAGVNLTTAWLDLQFLTNGFHPYNSHRNDEVRLWLLGRIKGILKQNNASASGFDESHQYADGDAAAHIFDDLTTNLTFSSPTSSLSVAFTGTNIMVYIRGSNDPGGQFWERQDKFDREKYLVMLNAHFDSVPSGYGATDDGVGVVSVLQAISHFTSPGKQPKRGMLALLNNGEEDYLNGAYAFTQHPIAKHVHTFMNLEGAAAGGRAILFRSTDTEVTRFYQRSPYPRGSVATADGFKRHLVRSDTDYSVFNGELGMRGLDVAFYEHRSRYHTVEDSSRYTSPGSVWHMLSATLATMEGLTSDLSSTFVGPQSIKGGVESGTGSDGVWFDVFGRTFATMKLHDMFAISVTLLVVTPVFLIILTAILAKVDKWYLFARKSYPDLHTDGGITWLGGWKGFFRYPITFATSTAAIVGLAYLVTKINPYIVYSSEYSVWAMMLTAWLVLVWFFLRGSDSSRPSALQRLYSILWIYIGMWVILVGDTVAENNLGLAGGYCIVIYFAAVFVALLISYFELFALPRKTAFAQAVNGYDSAAESRASSRPRTAATTDERTSREQTGDDTDERTSLLRGERTTFGGGYGSRGRQVGDDVADSDHEPDNIDLPLPYGKEQRWSGSLPRWTWLLQFIALGPVPVILVGQLGLLMGTGLHQTPSDGNSVLIIYLAYVILSVLLLLPLTPFLHRFHFQVPMFLLLICIGTLIYNLTAFPFSDHSRLKVYFVQRVDLNSGTNEVSLTGLMPFTKQIVESIPSSAGQTLQCSAPDYQARQGLVKCAWNGTLPSPLEKSRMARDTSSWLTHKVSLIGNATNEAIFHISGRNTRTCRILFDHSISDFNVSGYATDPRFPRVGASGCKEIRLWTREWGGAWNVSVKWDASGRKNTNSTGLSGRVVCLWSDANDPNAVPAFQEVLNYMPTWSMVTKLSDGLVEGWKTFDL